MASVFDWFFATTSTIHRYTALVNACENLRSGSDLKGNKREAIKKRNKERKRKEIKKDINKINKREEMHKKLSVFLKLHKGTI